MGLLAIRKQVIDLSGRFDLALDPENGDYSDKGADSFIQAGQMLLDLFVDLPSQRRRVQKDIHEGEFSIEVERLRAVYAVWITTEDGARIELKRKRDPFDLRRRRGFRTVISDQTPGRPRDWTVNVARLGPQQAGLSAGNYDEEFTRDWEDLILRQCCEGDPCPECATQILWGRPSDGDYTVTVFGKFFSPIMVEDCDSTIWTECYPHLLVRASLYAIEVPYRNTQGASDFLRSIEPELMQIDFDVAETESMVGGGGPGDLE